ncbi:four helix bundle protein [Empedobacter falsenii]|uniref:four helix bundle protein n=1 Tax=Empedobacter TaxID=59734 RepID=UPI00257811C3|nr:MULTISPECIES: four helix bundle protein [Empedobacter]MDM1042809.1 four helix bundle protein [Empedobacter brevis]MDM1136739.1 four helix bundle protein [Empedobacter sp. R750]
MKESYLLHRTFTFGVIKFLRTLPDTSDLKIIKYQLVKAATSIGANYEEVQARLSNTDFINKVNISLKEAREANYWLRMIQALEVETTELSDIIQESKELKNILGTIVKNSREN